MTPHDTDNPFFPIAKMSTDEPAVYASIMGIDLGRYELRPVHANAYSGLACDLFRRSIPTDAEAVTAITIRREPPCVTQPFAEYQSWRGIALVPKGRSAIAEAYGDQGSIDEFVKELDTIDPAPQR